MANRQAHYFQHVPFEGLGSMEGWLADNGYRIGVTRFYEADHQLPDPTGIGLLIIMGGPMSVNDEATLPWLAAEKQFIRDAIAAGVPVLGICLGAQLIASALGARVYPNQEPEIGWFEVMATNNGGRGMFPFPKQITAFHWHGETFDLPKGATLLASSHGCTNQAFQIGDNIIGLQCHLETTPDSAQALIKHCGDELVSADFVQSAGQILFAPPGDYAAINSLAGDILAFLTRGENQ